MEYTRLRPWVFAITVISVFIVSQVDSASIVKPRHHSIQKRTILQMCGLITLHTNGSRCLDYNGYGCFCGLGNRGTKPLDRVDTCCWKHDNCYGDVSCTWFYPQWVGYNIDCSNGRMNCQCTDSPQLNPCAYDTCRCDLRLAECLADAEYHHYHRNYNRQLCNHRVNHHNDGHILH